MHVILVDTHALLWFLSGDAALSTPRAKRPRTTNPSA
jgi:PIN domain nuclease of toxin-antitoxin system